MSKRNETSMRAQIMYRESKMFPGRVVCGVFLRVGDDVEYKDQISKWQPAFIAKFPEFQDATFTVQETEILW